MKNKLKKTLLLVEDETITAMAEKAELEKYGYNVIVAISGEESVDIFNKNSDIDLILMDVNLGSGMDGTEAATLILKNNNLPIVFLSSHIEHEIVEKTEKITSYGYVVKSSSVTVLDASIKMAFKLFEANKKNTKTEIKQKAMISNISDVIGIISADGIIEYKSPNIEKWFGWKPEDLVGTDAWKTVYPDDLKRLQKAFYTILKKDNSTTSVIYRYKCKDGSYKPIELTAINLVNDPDIGGILLNYHDITKRKRAEEALRESEETVKNKLQAILDPKGDIGTLNLADIIDYEAMQSMMEDFYKLTKIGSAVLDTSGKVLVAVGWQDICTKFHRCHPDTLKNCLESDTALASGVPAGEFKTYRCKNHLWDMVTPIEVGGRHLGNIYIGQFFYENEIPDYEIFRSRARQCGFEEIEYLSALERVPHWSRETVDTAMTFFSKFAGMISSLSYSSIKLSRALSRQEITLRRLGESESKLQQAQYIAGMGDFTWDFATGAATWSDGMYKLLRYDKNEPIDYDIVNAYIHHPDDLERVTKWLMDSVSSGMEFLVPNEYRLIRKDGQVIYVQTNGKIEYQDGKAVKLFGTCRDITDLKQAEKELKQQLSEKEIILKEVHHRIKNNVASIESMLSMQSESINNPEAVAALQDAISRIDSMRILYDKLLISEDYEEISVKKYIESLIDTIIILFPSNKKIAIDKRIDDFYLSSQYMFPVGIIINELLTNTMKYAFNGRDSGSINITLTNNKNHITFILQNNGIELPEDFDINTSKGFGFMLVRLFCKQLDGNFTIENHNGTKSVLQFDIK